MQLEKQEINNNTKHYAWIDYARFICLLLVIVNHIPYSKPYFFDGSLLLFRIPCFFFISGLLFKFEKYPTLLKFAKHRAKQILVPYFCFFLIAYLFWLLGIKKLYASADAHADVAFYTPVLEYLYGTPYTILWPMWFLACLFVLQCVFYVSFKKIKDRRLAVFLLLLFPMVPVLIDMEGAPWKLDAVCKYIFFYGMGYYFKKDIVALFEKTRKYYVAFILIVLHVLLVNLLEVATNVYLITYISIIASVSIILFLCIFIKLIADCAGRIKVIEYISTNAVVVLAWHTYFIRLIQLFFLYTFPAIAETLLSCFGVKLFFSTVIILSMSIPIYLINKYIPFVVGKGSCWTKK